MVAPPRRIGVVGLGTMGAAIAQVCIQAGLDVVGLEANEQLAQRGEGIVRKNLGRLVERDKLSAAARDEALGRLRVTTEYQRLADRDLVVEAIVELPDVKRQVFQKLGEVCDSEVVLSSNTSSLPVVEMAAAARHPERVVGTHFFNPPQQLKLVEIVAPLTAATEAVERAVAFVTAVGHVPIRVKDTPGFVVNRLFVPMALDAMRLYESGVASAEDIDRGCQLGLGHSMGPLATSDLIGLDTMMHVADSFYEEYGEARFKPPTVLKRLVAAGHLGRKTGRGFYTYQAKP